MGQAFRETLDKSGGRYQLCQWQDEAPDGEYLGRECYRRTADVFCAVHSRRLGRETQRRRKADAEDELEFILPPGVGTSE